MKSKKKLVFITGAGISAESGLSTFRDSGGLWEKYRVEEVASINAWHLNKELVLKFYNERRAQAFNAQPNIAHFAVASFEKKFDVDVITQNVDDLHERSGSLRVLHLHGKLCEVRSEKYANLVYNIKGEAISTTSRCERGFQLRPNIVWFGEEVPNMPLAISMVGKADIVIVIGTSLTVYPAASLLFYANKSCNKYFIDPNITDEIRALSGFTLITEKASVGVPKLANILLNIE